MPEYQEYTAALPVYLFVSGDDVVIARMTREKRDDVTVRVLEMILPSPVINRYSIMPHQLDKSKTSFGIFKQAYPEAYFWDLPSTPENPRSIVFCNFFDGAPCIDTKLATEVAEKARLREQVDGLQAEVSKYFEALKEARDRIDALEQLSKGGVGGR